MASEDQSTLSVRVAPGGFKTSGSINWTELVSATIGWTVEFLSRVSAAGVDPYTMVVGQRLGAQFQLTPTGRSNIVTAMRSLRSFGSLGRYLELGFGVKHLVRILAKTEEGLMCLSLCAALAECYDVAIAAEILVEMVKTSRAPEDLRPSILEWQALLHACAGSLAATQFPVLAEKYMQLHPTDRRLSYLPLQGVNDLQRGCSSPESMARALLAIGKVSNAKIESITITGGADTGFLVAFCEWHFQISCRVVHEKTDGLLHASGFDSTILENGDVSMEPKCQITFIFTDHLASDHELVGISDQTYRLTDATKMIQLASNASFSAASVSGRVSWSALLSTEFGHEGKILLEDTPRAFGGMLGCLCRIAKGVASADPAVPPIFRELCCYYDETSYGRGLASSLIRIFPELSPVKAFLDDGSRQGYTRALEIFESHLVILKNTCGCRICRDDLGAQDVYCLVLLAETLFVIARTMSCVASPPLLLPSRLGIEALYGRQYELRLNAWESGDLAKRLKMLGLVSYAIDGRGWSTNPLWDALMLYTGRVETTADELSANATVRSGLCCFWSSLLSFSDERVPAGHVTILPGHIELHKKSYNLMLDTQPFQQPKYVLGKPKQLLNKDVSFVVQEKAHALHAHFDVTSAAQEGVDSTEIMPAFFNNDWTHFMGRVSCEGLRRCKKMSCTAKESSPGHMLHELGENTCEVYDNISPIEATYWSR